MRSRKGIEWYRDKGRRAPQNEEASHIDERLFNFLQQASAASAAILLELKEAGPAFVQLGCGTRISKAILCDVVKALFLDQLRHVES